MGFAVTLEEPREGELAQLMPDHLLRDINRQKFPAVMHREGMPDEFGGNGAVARPRFDRFFLAGCIHLLDLLQKDGIYEGSLLSGSAHFVSSCCRRRALALAPILHDHPSPDLPFIPGLKSLG